MEVTYIDHMGSDLRVANAARVSFNKESEWEWDIDYDQVPCGKEVKRLSEQDQKLITYLAKHNHWTPFSHVQITLREKVPIFVARQRFKHMVGFTYNEVSRRYVDDEPEFFVPDAWRKRPDKSIKQGSSDETIEYLWDPWSSEKTPTPDYSIKDRYIALLQEVEELYHTMIENEVAPEQARMVLPQSMYTEYYCTGSLAAWARAYKLRIDSHAQKEIRDLAVMWDKVISEIKDLQHSWKVLKE